DADRTKPVGPVLRRVGMADQRFIEQLGGCLPPPLGPTLAQTFGMTDDHHFPADDVVAAPAGALARDPGQNGSMRPVSGEIFIAPIGAEFHPYIGVPP